MGIWNIRNQALYALASELQQEKEVLEETFALFDVIVERFYDVYLQSNEKKVFAAVCCQTLLKLQRYALGTYSLYLDSLELEAGSLMRSLVEGWQLLIYFRLEPTRTEKVIFQNLPNMGTVASEIDDKLHDEIKETLRQMKNHFSENSSHFSLKEQAIRPIGRIFVNDIFWNQIRLLYIVIAQILSEASKCFSIISLVNSSLKKDIADLQERGLNIFGTYKYPESAS